MTHTTTTQQQPFSANLPLDERMKCVVDALKDLQRSQGMATKADIKKKLGIAPRNATDARSAERLVDALAHAGLLIIPDEGRCRTCGRPLGKGPYYSIPDAFFARWHTPIRSEGPGT